MVDSPKGATPLEHKTLTAAVKCPSLTFHKLCLILGSFLLSSPLPETLLGTSAPPPPPLLKREETRSVKPNPSFHNTSTCKMLLHCRDFLFSDLRSCLEEGLTTLSVQHGNKSN
ncbi:hypothetical protein HanIR_Chr12g0575521 [Helianthus annuus]|nr:hypothetical protein HanIR_Chr12g0575521 [Helianthus annuus]